MLPSTNAKSTWSLRISPSGPSVLAAVMSRWRISGALETSRKSARWAVFIHEGKLGKVKVSILCYKASSES